MANDRSMNRKVVFEPYDMDTGLGTNNSGVLMFNPYLEDTDHVSSIISGEGGGSDAPVYNAQDSALWNNLRDAFPAEKLQMYRNLRADSVWNYQKIAKLFQDHQSKWPEAIFNEDAWLKYIIPLVDPVTKDESTGELIRTDRYLTMLQGSKEEQRKWWLYNRFRYLDSKYNTGDATANVINMRLFSDGTLNIKAAINLYIGVAFGGGTTPILKRTEANVAAAFPYVAPTGVTEMETWIYSADLITDVGDLSIFYPNECDFSRATRLRKLKIGSSASGYSNANLTTLNVQNARMLEEIDCRNCPNLAITVNMENSPRLEKAYFDGTAVTGVEVADGGVLEILHLPSTITSLTLQNLSKLTDLTVASYANVSRLMIANISSTILDVVSVLSAMPANSMVNIQGFYKEFTDFDDIEDFYDLLDTMTGVTREKNAGGEWIYHEEAKAVVTGTVHTGTLTGAQIDALLERYPYIEPTADHITTLLKYYNYDGSTLLETQTITDGGDGTYAGTPARAEDSDWKYTFIGWNKYQDQYAADPDATKAVVKNRSVYAAYSRTSRAELKYYNYDGSELLHTQVIYGGGDGDWNGAPSRDSTAQYTFLFAGWSTTPNGNKENDATKNVTTHRSVYAAYTKTIRTYTVKFANEGVGVLQTVENVPYGSTAQYTGSTPQKDGVPNPEDFEFIGWSPSNVYITGTTTCWAQFAFAGTLMAALLTKQITGIYSNSEITAVRSYAFYSCTNLVGVSLPNVKTIGRQAFSDCSKLTEVYIPSVEKIEYGAFMRCSIASISLPELKEVGAAFGYCSQITELSFPKLESVTGAFLSNMTGLQSVYLGGSQFVGAPWGVADGWASGLKIYVRESLVSVYQTASYWSSRASRIYSYAFE